MNLLSQCFINLFYCTIISIISFHCSTVEITKLSKQYQKEYYANIYRDIVYEYKSKVAMQLYKFFSEKRLVNDTINIIFKFCCATDKVFFKECKNCAMHDKILKRGPLEFPLFKITNSILWDNLSMKQTGFEIKLNEKEILDENLLSLK